jgi:hypothetical protein
MTFNTRLAEPYRIRTGRMGSDSSFGCNGQFTFPVRSVKGRGQAGMFPAAGQSLQLVFARGTMGLRHAWNLYVQISDQDAWEHCSISLPARCPTWEEMAFVAGLFWDPEDTVIQYRPAASSYVNCHPFCLHWFRPIGVTLPTPPSFLVGPVG